jgi:hypothetical protein
MLEKKKMISEVFSINRKSATDYLNFASIQFSWMPGQARHDGLGSTKRRPSLTGGIEGRVITPTQTLPHQRGRGFLQLPRHITNIFGDSKIEYLRQS